MTDNKKYVKCGQALIIRDDPQRYEEVTGADRNRAGCAVPVRRVAVCGPGGGKIDDMVVVQASAGNAD